MHTRIPGPAIRPAWLLLSLALLAGGCPRTSSGPVRLEQTGQVYILDNGIVRAEVAKASGDIVSLRYEGREMFATFLDGEGAPDLERDPPGENLEGLNRGMTDHQYGFWSHDAMGRRGTGDAAARVTIDPSANGGRRAEVSVKGVSGGVRALGTGPGANRDNGDFFADVEIRYAVERGDSGVYTYCIFEHKPGYPATSITEARFCMKLHAMFDWMLNDRQRNKFYPATDRENKYNYTANQFENRAFGWASTAEGIGCFLVNPSMEYMSGGPTKVEFLTHRDTNEIAAPCVLNYWRSSHYGGAVVSVDKDEQWSKVIGPFLIYCNRGADPQAILGDARARQASEESRWPYAWVDAPAYPVAAQRGGVRGRLVLDDPLAPEGAAMSRALVGLTHPGYEMRPGFEVGWQQDAKFYQFWVRAGEDGTFAIPGAHPGTYVLRAFADGVLGEFARSGVQVSAGRLQDLGEVRWTPVRRGRQLWDVGIPNRNSREFLKGDDYYHDGMEALYAELFPGDVHYVVGQSDFARDVYFQHVPHLDPAASDDAARRAAEGGQRFFFGPPQVGRATPWTIEFDLPEAPGPGRAVLRLAISGTGARSIDVAVNGRPAGQVPLGMGDSTFSGRNGIQGIWYERELGFDASALLSGRNTLTLTIPAGRVGAGVMYDYLRLELVE